MRRAETLLVVVAVAASLWLYSGSSLRNQMTRTEMPRARHRFDSEQGASLSSVFAHSDADRDGKLNLEEFSEAAAALVGSGPNRVPSPVVLQLNTSITPTSTADTMRNPDSELLPQCSLLFFYHIVKTAGTTMRTVLQRQAQLADFEYIYTDTTTKPRWQLIMHQLSHRVIHRRVIIELHSEWGLPLSFYADVRRIREMYAPLGCRVTLATVVRHPVAFYLSYYNWRAANHVPLCLWDPPMDAQSRQLMGFGLPFVSRRQSNTKGGRGQVIPPEAAVSVLNEFDVVGLTEKFDLSLLAIANASGIKHLGYARLAANNKPKKPALANAVLNAVLADAAVGSVKERIDNVSPVNDSDFVLATGTAGASTVQSGRPRSWSSVTALAMEQMNAESMESLLDRVRRAPNQQQPSKADCNFYPCAAVLENAKGIVAASQCAGMSGGQMLTQMLKKTATDRAMHAEALRRLDLAARGLERRRGRPSLTAQLEAIQTASKDVERRRIESVGENKQRLCGVRLCGDPLRSCIGCEPNVVPGMEPCWPSWEDQFAPDEQKFWCKRSMTHPGWAC